MIWKMKIFMQNNDEIIKNAIETLCYNQVLPKEKLSEITGNVEILKKQLQALTKDELETLLKKIPENEIEKIKNQIS